MASTREILLVEDNPGDAYLVCDVLNHSPQPCHVAVAVDGLKAIDFLRQHDSDDTVPDLVLLDLNLPLKDGRAVLSELKGDADLRRIPVVVFSSSDAASDVERCYELGANCYVRKPGNLVEFVSAVEAMSRFWFGPATLPAKPQAVDAKPAADPAERLRKLLKRAGGVPPRIGRYGQDESEANDNQ
ncbi:MAG: response regulator [Candidatus Korobacteraceae bacterium]|jgi:CheY-like chemotaxis protein